MPDTLHINMLGSLQVKIGDKPADFRTDALRVMLAYLAAHQGIPQRRDSLAGLLSPDRPNKEALTYLRNRLTRLRQSVQDDKANPPWFEIDRKQITLRPGDDIVVDVTEFEAHLAAAETHPHRELAGCPICLAHLQDGVELVRGEFLAGLNFPSETWESWLLSQREHVQQRSLEAMSLLREARTVLGEWEAVIDIAQRQLALEPWLEEAHRDIMQAHYHLGDRNAALAQYETCTERLWEELGVDPEEETIALHQQIVEMALEVMEHTETADNLPLQTGPFVGREAEQALLLKRLVDPNYRLMTLVGPGGIGKTRLSLEVGKRVKTSFPDGVWFVPLDAVKGGEEQIKIAVGEALGLGQEGKQLSGDQVIVILREKRVLLLFDNSEVKLEELAFIPEWLKRAPHIAILATSREPLNFQAESTVILQGLPTGDTETEGVSAAEALFAERGQMARDDFEVSANNLPQVRQICELVDGSPLGIALAAAWVRRRSLTQIVESINRSLDFLSTRLRDIGPRHRSMRAVFETSWELLTSEEQQVLATLSVFPSSFSADAAEQITGGSFFDFDSLCEKSLLQQQQEAERYQMHSLVRQFAAEKLGERRPEVERGFVDYYFRLAALNRDNYSELRPEWLNFTYGVRKAHLLERWKKVINFAQILRDPQYHQMRFKEMEEGQTLALEATKKLQDFNANAQVQLNLGEALIELNQNIDAEHHLSSALSSLMRLEDDLGVAKAKYFLGRLKFEQSQDDEAIKLFEESKELYAESADWLGVAKNLNLIAMGHVGKESGYEIADKLLEESIAIQKPFPLSVTYVEALRHSARIKGNLDDHASAGHLLDEALTVSQELQDMTEYVGVLQELTILNRLQGDLDKAMEFGNECLKCIAQVGSIRWEAMAKTQLAMLHHAKTQYELSLDLHQQALAIYSELNDLFSEAYTNYHLYKIHQDIGDETQSNFFKLEALRLNQTLKDVELRDRLA